MKTMILLSALVGAQAACKSDSAPAKGADPALAKRAEIERGQHLVMTSGCHDCHTPLKMGPNGPEPDFSRELSGHPHDFIVPPPPASSGPWVASILATNTAWAGPWGVSFTRNLTPDKETGLGSWTKQMFIDTIRNGRHMGVGRPLLPPMPFPMYKHMTDDELGAVFAYLQSLPPIKNAVPEPLPPQQASAPAAAADKTARL
ncbi:MAG TPA: c-type cytochrome [Kofleriaceae bacterium]|nr:c-type cytochrome [Kofleriaceae bacterium]